MKAWAPIVTCRVSKPAVCSWPWSCNTEPRLVGVRDRLSRCAENAACVTGCGSPRRFGTGFRLSCSVGCRSQACLISPCRAVGTREPVAASPASRCSQNVDQAGSSLVCCGERFLMLGFGDSSWHEGVHEQCVSLWLRGTAQGQIAPIHSGNHPASV